MGYKILSLSLVLSVLSAVAWAKPVKSSPSSARNPAQSVGCEESQFSIWFRGSDFRYRNGQKEFIRTEPEEFPKIITKDAGTFDEILFKGSDIVDVTKSQVRISLKGSKKDLNASIATFKLKPFDAAPGFFVGELVDINSYIQKLYTAGGGTIMIESIQDKPACKIEITVEYGH